MYLAQAITNDNYWVRRIKSNVIQSSLFPRYNLLNTERFVDVEMEIKHMNLSILTVVDSCDKNFFINFVKL